MLGGRYYPMGIFIPVYPMVEQKKKKTHRIGIVLDLCMLKN